ncbi:shikimate O-hydroxycinnamoyltransferase-like [Magnolia sinica]|uniref:shikimate O-hydroxycinnamoyltransferase-like n=1 Tax=Magnolia sinica TaxID=86752 RepID=UPI00265A2C46|nr:shikimate O-hydroxycinnamoyltransferase-like [Magnolia sinica]
MIINITESSMVQPAQDAPIPILRLCTLDQVMLRMHIPTIYFYRPTNGSSNFFDPEVLKSALSESLVPYYPMAGRLRKDEDGRLEIDCNGEGALFVEAYTDSVIDELGDFTPTPTSELKCLVPRVDYNKDMSSNPILVVQVTYFKCGGVSLGAASTHVVADGPSQFNFIKHWAEVARGIEPTIQPFVDRSIVRARDPPTPSFKHIEFQPPLLMDNPPKSPMENRPAVALLKISSDQLNLLKSKCKDETNDNVRYSSFEALTSHVWQCMCKAIEIPKDQQTRIFIPVNGRARLRPELPLGFFGNAIFTTTSSAAAGDIASEQLPNTVARIRDSLVRMDDEYLKSALDYLEVQPDLTPFIRGSVPLGHPSVSIVSWVQLPVYDADFGWGAYVYGSSCNFL